MASPATQLPSEFAEPDRSFVTALARGLKVLETLSREPDGLGNTALARVTGLPKPTVTRLTHTLVSLGYLRFDKARSAYSVTPKLMSLGVNAAAIVDMADLAMPELKRLRDGPNSGVTASLTEFVGARVIWRTVVQSRQQNALWMQAGVVADVLQTAAGRVKLVASDPSVQQDMIKGIKAQGGTEADIDSEFQAAKEEYASKGYCTGFRRWRADVNAIAVPICVPGSHKMYSISVGGPAVYVGEHELEMVYAPLLKAAAARIEEQIHA